jgi:hypothetical protein
LFVAAEILLGQMLKAPGVPTASTMGAVNALLQTYLDQDLPPAELASKITCVRQAMVRGGLELDRKGLSLLLEAAVCMNKPEVYGCEFFFRFLVFAILAGSAAKLLCLPLLTLAVPHSLDGSPSVNCRWETWRSYH